MVPDRRGLHPRKQPRQARAELTRARILDAAARVFAEHGYAAGTTNRIAEEARISIGSLYQYYPGKDAILVELLSRHLDEGSAATARRMEQELPGPLEAIVRVFVRLVIENHREDSQLLRVLSEQVPHPVEVAEKMARNERERVDYVRALLDHHPEVRVRDTATAARIAVSTVEFVVHHTIASPDPVDLTRFEDELVDMLTLYLTAGRSSPTEG
ncbi:TetR/AcrR family transcriptional regulator [Umezawaea tangerina]|uniref:TetR family transcriptional regulator n=1 Tax=Umezawaea tangerina TaxID=84725 RepID=A0A2T0SN57_9PSEU|nr:TetR/AcrR family transcriptional regulator [Umezawaea tangerina]PRY34813.1 TetR family transcriptional regulator [Umezawaea tangerina]